MNLDGNTLRISLSDEVRRRIGAISLPVTHVEMEFRGLNDAAVREFLRLFDRAYQKGGG